jgi:hypothetical protein
MPDTVSINAWLSQSVSGQPSYSPTATTHPCRIEMKNHLVVNWEGREVLAKGRVFLGTTFGGSVPVPSVKDKITLPVEYTPLSPPILAVNVQPDEMGTHHVTLEIG